MSALAHTLARICWYWMLRSMRTQWMKRLQRWWLSRVPEQRRETAWQSVVQQNRLARRYGLRLLTVSITLLLASVVITLLYYAATLMLTRGLFDAPPEIGSRQSR